MANPREIELIAPPSASEPSSSIRLEAPPEAAPVATAYDDDEKTDPGIVPRIPVPPPPPARLRRPTAPTPPPEPRAEISAPPTPPSRMPDLGLLTSFMADPSVTEIMVNDLRNVMIEKGGVIGFSGARYSTIDELNRLVRNILDLTGKILTPDSPYVDLMLPDGSRVNIVGPPLTKNGPSLTIRKFPSLRYNVESLTQSGMMDRRMAQFLTACVVGKINVLISGGTGTGKTTLLNAMSELIPKSERLVVIEDIPELQISHVNSVCLQTKPQTPGSAAIPARDLVANALRMRPDRIIVGECRRAEAFDMLQAMNTGHSGSMTTLHANAPRDALARLETLCLLAGSDLPLSAVRRQMASAIDLIIQIRRFRSGKRRIVGMTEITGMEGDILVTQDLFHFQPSLTSAQPDAGEFASTGLVPTFLERLRENGVDIPAGFFA